MPGTHEGGKAAAQTIKDRYGKGFFAKIGSEGGKKSKTGGWYQLAQENPEKHRQLSSKGGKLSRRSKAIDRT
jgi:hypothetical protein